MGKFRSDLRATGYAPAMVFTIALPKLPNDLLMPLEKSENNFI